MKTWPNKITCSKILVCADGHSLAWCRVRPPPQQTGCAGRRAKEGNWRQDFVYWEHTGCLHRWGQWPAGRRGHWWLVVAGCEAVGRPLREERAPSWSEGSARRWPRRSGTDASSSVERAGMELGKVKPARPGAVCAQLSCGDPQVFGDIMMTSPKSARLAWQHAWSPGTWPPSMISWRRSYLWRTPGTRHHSVMMKKRWNEEENGNWFCPPAFSAAWWPLDQPTPGEWEFLGVTSACRQTGGPYLYTPSGEEIIPSISSSYSNIQQQQQNNLLNMERRKKSNIVWSQCSQVWV